MTKEPGFIKNLTKKIHKTQYPAIDPANPANSAAGKTVLVTGGASGIGHAIVRAFALAGASTVVYLGRRAAALSSSAQDLRREFPQTAFWTYAVDLADRDGVERTFADVRARLRQGDAGSLQQQQQQQQQPPARDDVDVLVLNAACTEQGLGACAYADDEVRRSFETNVLGNLHAVRALLGDTADLSRARRDRKVIASDEDSNDDEDDGERAAATAAAEAEGRRPKKVIIDVSSASAYAPIRLNAVYGASKAAFTHLAQHVQLEHPAAVRVHSFNPGIVYTAGMQRAGFAEDQGFEWDDPSLAGGFAVWLASPAAAFLKGRFVFASWDVEEMVGMKERFERDQELCRILLNV